MERDALLLLLVGAVMLNLGLLVAVALVQAAPWRVESTSRPDPHPRRMPAVARQARSPVTGAHDGLGGGLGGARPMPFGADVDWSAFRSVAARGAISRPPTARRVPVVSAVASSPSPTTAAATAEARAAAAPAAAVPPAELAVAVAEAPEVPAVIAPSEPAEPAQPPERPRPSRPASAPSRRPRRFTIPDLDEDHDRVTRSIGAFLGEPVAPAADARPHRRRHRARRPAGDTPRTDLILSVSGDVPGGRLHHAVAGALREAVRESDAVVELPGARLRVTLETDDAGAEAFLARARSVVRPWLDLLAPSAQLRREGEPAAEASAAG